MRPEPAARPPAPMGTIPASPRFISTRDTLNGTHKAGAMKSVCPKHSVFQSLPAIWSCTKTKPKPTSLIKQHSSKAREAFGSVPSRLPPGPPLPMLMQSKEHDTFPTRLQTVHKGCQLLLYCSIPTPVINNNTWKESPSLPATQTRSQLRLSAFFCSKQGMKWLPHDHNPNSKQREARSSRVTILVVFAQAGMRASQLRMKLKGRKGNHNL